MGGKLGNSEHLDPLAQIGIGGTDNLKMLYDLMSSPKDTMPPPTLLSGLENHGTLLGGLSGSLGGKQSVPTPPLAKAFVNLSTTRPDQPSMTTLASMKEAEQRFTDRLRKMQGILPIVNGRVIPDDDDLIIGDARRFRLAVLFLDICKFSNIESYDGADQDRVLTILNLFMAEMLHVIKKLGGNFEKNTGDGLMAYFGPGDEGELTQSAIDAAVTMHFFNDEVITPRLNGLGLPAIKFRVGIETGLVTLSNVGVRGDHHSIVAIGNTPNVACKLMSLLPHGGIVVGNYTRTLLTEKWKNQTSSVGHLPGWVIKNTTTPYPAYEIKYRVPRPFDWAAPACGLGGVSQRLLG